MDRQGIGEEEKESLLARWMTMVMLTGHYQSGGEGTVLKDYANATEEGFASYLAQIEELKLTEEFYDSILPDKFASTTARTAPFLVYVATQCARGVHSLFSDIKIKQSPIRFSRKPILPNVDIKQEKSTDRLQTLLTFQKRQRIS